jgi:drug/metabolite transporter (DMT)-like permease
LATERADRGNTIVATLLAVLVLRELLSATGWAGMALLLAGLAVIAINSRRH